MVHGPSSTMTQVSNKTDRRKIRERRQFVQNQFPLADFSGNWVYEDRRKVPDRRLGNYEVEELDNLSFDDFIPEKS